MARRYPLETLHKVRHIDTVMKESRVAETRRSAAEAESRARAASERRRDSEEQLTERLESERRRLGEGAARAADLARAEAWRKTESDRIKRLAMFEDQARLEAAHARAEAEAARNLSRAAHRELEVTERHRSRWRTEQRRTADDTADDDALDAWNGRSDPSRGRGGS